MEAERSQFFKEIKIIGKGGFGEVIQAIDNESGQEIAVKIIKKNQVTPQDIQSIKKEAILLDQMDHSNIVKFKCIHEGESEIYLCMELMEGGNLYNLMRIRRKQNCWLTEKEVQLIIKQILSAVAYIHSQNIVHRDIKPENIMIAKLNDINLIKIADFGLSTKYSKGQTSKVLSHQCGTTIYMAPEQILQKQYSRPVDVFACGIIMYMLLSNGQHPLYERGESFETYKQKIIEQQFEWKFSQSITELAKSLLIKMVETEPIDRYTAEQALNHPWITGKGNKVPLTAMEIVANYEIEMKAKKLMNSLLLLVNALNQNHQQMFDSSYLVQLEAVNIAAKDHKIDIFQQQFSKSYIQKAQSLTFDSNILLQNVEPKKAIYQDQNASISTSRIQNSKEFRYSLADRKLQSHRQNDSLQINEAKKKQKQQVKSISPQKTQKSSTTSPQKNDAKKQIFQFSRNLSLSKVTTQKKK